MIETLKRKCTSFFEKEDRSIIGEAVEVIHSIMSEATHLLKAYYLKKFDIDSSEIVIVDAILLSNCCDIVRGHETLSVRQREVKKTPENENEEQAKLRKQYADKKASEKKREADTFKEIYAVYKDVGISNIFVDLSISHILSYSVEQMITAYKNNVFLHFPKYVKRYVTCIMMSEAGIGRDFSTDNTIKQQQRTLLCGYGNWGRNPNLKNNAPTPGIGLRRRFDQKIPTITVCEKNTSQTCPCCGVKGLVNEKVGEDNIEKHHLLCCTNSSCECRWWNRNVVGSYNILGNFLNVCGLITKPATSSLP